MITLDDLHDATIDQIELSWVTGSLKYKIQAYLDGKDSVIEILGQGLTSLEAPRFEPWGPSASINKAWRENSGEAIQLIIEMQSGDIIKARIKQYEINIFPPN